MKDLDQIRQQITSFEQLPSYEDARYLIEQTQDPSQSDFYKFCMRHKIRQVINREFVDSLAAHLLALQEAMMSKQPIVEMLAGSGKLSHNLRQRGVDVIPTDDYSEEMWRSDIVEELDYKEALGKYNPKIVLVSWAPNEEGLETTILDHPSVRLLVTVGEQGDGSGGREIFDVTPPIYMPEVSQYSLCLRDVRGEIGHSRILGFEGNAAQLEIEYDSTRYAIFFQERWSWCLGAGFGHLLGEYIQWFPLNIYEGNTPPLEYWTTFVLMQLGFFIPLGIGVGHLSQKLLTAKDRERIAELEKILELNA